MLQARERLVSSLGVPSFLCYWARSAADMRPAKQCPAFPMRLFRACSAPVPPHFTSMLRGVQCGKTFLVCFTTFPAHKQRSARQYRHSSTFIILFFSYIIQLGTGWTAGKFRRWPAGAGRPRTFPSASEYSASRSRETACPLLWSWAGPGPSPGRRCSSSPR